MANDVVACFKSVVEQVFGVKALGEGAGEDDGHKADDDEAQGSFFS